MAGDRRGRRWELEQRELEGTAAAGGERHGLERRPATGLVRALVAAVPWAAFLVFAANTADHLVARSLCCADDAFLAVVAKNLAQGDGYTASYWTGPGEPATTGEFAPGITTGPTLIVPAAAAIRALGPRYWVGGAVSWLVSMGLLAALLLRVRRLTASPAAFAVASILAIAALNLVTAYHYEHWFALLGEAPALLFAAHGLLFLAKPRVRRDLLAGGLLLGLAFQTKALALLALPPALAIALLAVWRRSPLDSKPPQRLRATLAAGAFVVLAWATPTVAFEAFKLAELGPAGYRQATVRLVQMVGASRASGVAEPDEGGRLARLRSTASENARSLAELFRGGSAVAFVATLGLGLAAGRRWQGRESPVPLALMAVAAVFAGWWILLSNGGRIRYLLIGLGLWCFAVALDLTLDGWSARKVSLLTALAITLAPRVALLPAIRPPTPLFTPSPRVQAMLAAARFLEDHRDGRLVVADWWAAAVDMEYLLAGSRNLVFHRALRTAERRPVLFYENAKWIDLAPGARERWSTVLARHGAVPVFEQDVYRVYASETIADVDHPALPVAAHREVER